jgi:sporulation protein YlmC with PRC-barrel domain
MLAKYLTAGVAGSLLLASAAFAAENATSPSTTTSTSQATATNTSFQGDWRVSKVVGLNVYNDQNENVGSINDMLMDKGGSIKAAVISVGGFLGLGSRLVAVPYDKIKFSNEPVAYTGASNAPSSGAPNTGGAKPPMSSTNTTGSATSSSTTSKPNPWYPDHALLSATKDELQKMPEFKYSTE